MITKLLNRFGLYTQEQMNAMENYCQALEKRAADAYDNDKSRELLKVKDAEIELYKKSYEELSLRIDKHLDDTQEINKYLNLPDKKETIDKSENVIRMREEK